jgi:hypothetical protein
VQSTWVHSGSGSSSERIVSKLCCILLTKLSIWLSVLQCFWIRESYNTPDRCFVHTNKKKKKRINLINWQSLVFSYVYRNVPLDVALYALHTNNVG